MAKQREMPIRYKTNPFIEDLSITYKSKQVSVSALGKDNNILVNQETGEVTGTHVVTYKKVDSAEFIKLFAKNIALTFELSGAGFKTLMVLVWVMQNNTINRDNVTLDQYTFDDFHSSHGVGDPPLVSNFAISTFKKGLAELVRAKIIANSVRRGDYFINPNFVFNGSRIAFTNAIERVSDEELKKEQDASEYKLEQESDG